MAEQITVVMDVIAKMDKAEAGFKKLQGTLQKFKLPDNLDSGFKKSFANIESLFARYRSQLEKGFETKADVSGFIKTSKAIDIELDKLSKHFTELTGKEIDFKIKTDEIKKAEKDIADLALAKEKFGKDTLQLKIEGIKKDELSSVKKALEELQRITKGNTGKAAGNILEGLDVGNIQQVKKGMDDLLRSFKNVKSEAKLIDIKKAFGLDINDVVTKIINTLRGAEGEMDTFSEKSKKASDNLQQIKANQIDNVGKQISEAANECEHLRTETQKTTAATQEYARATQSMSQQLGDLRQSTQYFFSLRNMINLLKRGIDEAVQSVKDLDKAMTETAVVTDYKVSDLWGMLPEYTKVANQLGATTQGAYETMTLYYQQGLEQQQAFELGAETMKMARIAGLDYAETTDMMTAALRGFNMELNEVSAKRVNDVYSELAAITASDTEELGTAMQRTASIAHSAGASFEGTTAFLAQAIETTREPAENIGTAMKTIVARFQEMKKNPLEITEVEGEEVNYNKIDAALKTIGVDLKDTNGQFRDFDQVMLDISARWDSLSQSQQRYIATTAAGSRQQSRFIAMVSNYDRTMQLMEAANNSAGASDEQFGKTMDSLESKLNKLHNAWQEFTMGIADNGMIKLAVDGLTGALNIVNKLIDTFSLGIGPVKSFISIFTAFTGLKAAGRFANAAIGGLGGLIDPQSSFAQGFGQGALGNKQATNAAQAQMIYQPIVAELRAIRQLKGQEITQENRARIGAYDQYNRLKESRAFLGGLTKGGKTYSLQDIQQSLAGLDAKSQNVLMRGNAGTAYSMTNAILSKYYKQLGGDRKAISSIKNAERYLNNQRQAGQLTWEEYFKHISNPELMRAALDKSKAGANVADNLFNNLNKTIEAESQQYISRETGKLYAEYLKAGKDTTNTDIQKEINAKAQQAAKEKVIQQSYSSVQNNKLASTLDSIGRFGSGISQVGIGIQSFGNILTSSANPALQMFGSVLTSIGGLVNGLGMGISTISTGFTALATSETMEAAASWLVTAAKGPEAASSAAVAAAASALTGGLLVLVAVVAGVAFAIKKHNENIKKAAEEVTQNYKDKSSENQSNLANLKQWRSELAVLSKGVDKNGLNVSLDTSDYDHYLEIVDGIAKINPSIVQGYNAQGHAIIDNNKALEETLALEQQREKDILNEYTSDESLSKLLKARNLEGRRQAGGGLGTKYVETIPFELKPRTNMRQEISAIGDELRRNKNYIDLSPLNIDIDALASGSEAEFNKVVNQYDEFKGLVLNSINAAGDEWSDASREAIEKSFSAYGESASQLNEIVQPVYEALSAKASQTAGFKQMENSLKAPFQNALKELATTGDFKNSGKAIGEAAKNMATKFASYNDIYLDAMDEVAEANEQFALDLNEQNYEANTEDAIQSLENLKKTLEDTPEGHAISEWVDNEIAQIRNHMSGGAKSIEEAWDTISDKVSVAEGALEDFNNKTEKDFSTAAEGMQKIYETAMGEDTYHSIGLGDNTFWEAAQKLLGTDNIMDKSMNEVRGMMKDVEPFLKEGPEGVQNFASKVADLSGELEKVEGVAMTSDGWFESIDENVNPEAWKEIANILGISEELLTSMINKSRQFRQWDFSDMDAVRAAYAADDTVIHGTDNQLFITDSELRDRMGSDYYQKSERENKIDELSAKNIKVLPEHLKDLDTSIMKNEMGINNMTDAIEKFGQTGVFDKTEIRDAAETLAREQQGKDFNLDKFNEDFNNEWSAYLENIDYPMLQPVQSIESYVAAIADSITNKEIAEGNLTERKSDELEQAIYGERGKIDSLANYFKLGQDASGNQLDEYTYNKSLNELTDLQSSGQKYLESLEEGLGKATGEEQARYFDEINKTKQYLSDLNKAIEAGKQKWEEFNKQDLPEEPETPEVLPSNKTPDPYTDAEKELYTRNNNILGNLADKIINLYNNPPQEGQVDLTPQQQQKMYGEGANQLNEAGESLNTGATALEKTGGSLDTAAHDLSSAATSLNQAASVLSQSSQGNQSIPHQVAPGMPSNIPQNNQTSTNGVITIDNSLALAALQEIESKTQETKNTIEAGATFKVKVKDSGLKRAAKQANSITKTPSDKNISITATAKGLDETKALTQAVKDFRALGNKTISLVASASGTSGIYSAITAIKEFYKLTNDTVTVTTIHKNEYPGKATGSRNHGYMPAPPSVGSAARGNYGQLGPKGKGGLTLAGELGYEIAWIPSENRSMILGANGPQMINLPGDAVVWTHEQSKKILAQKSIPAGSHSKTTAKTTGGWDYSNSSDSDSSGGGGGSGSDTARQKALQKQQQQNADEAEKIIKKAGKVTVWWENQTRKIDELHRKADKSLNNFNTLIKNGTLSMAEIRSKVGNEYVKQLNSAIKADKRSYTRASAELDILDKGSGNGKSKTTYKKLGKGSKDTTGVKALQTALKKAGYSINVDGKFGSQTEKALKDFQKKNNIKGTKGKTNKATIQALDKIPGVSVSELKSVSSKGKKLIENGGSWANISYQVSKKDKNGKTKKESKETKVNLSKYIKGNKIDQKKIDEVGLGKWKYKKGKKSQAAQDRLQDAKTALDQAKKSGDKQLIQWAQREYDKAEKNAKKYRYRTKGNKSKAEAIKNAAESELNKRIQRQNKAEDDWIKDKKALEEYENQMIDAFRGWKNELTEIYAITTDIAATESKIGLARAQNDYAKAQIDLLDLTKGLSTVSEDLGKRLKEVGTAYKTEISLLDDNIEALERKQDANDKEIYQALHLSDFEKEQAKKAKEAEVGTIIGSSEYYTGLSETAKNAYAKDLLINGGFLKESETNPGMHIFDAEAVQKAIENNEITGELGGRLKTLFDIITEAEQNGLDIETELNNKMTERLQKEEEEKQYYKDIANQLFGWKNELTELLEITNKLKQATANQDYLQSAQDFLQAQMQAGFEVSTEQIMAIFKGGLDSSIATIQTTQAAIIRQEEQMQKDLTGSDLVKDLEAIDNLIANDTEGNMNVLLAQRQNVLDKIEAAQLVRENTYGSVTQNTDGTLSIDYDQDAIESAVRRGDLTESVGQELIEYYQTLEADSEEYKKLQQELLKNVTDVYKELGEVIKQRADAAKSLREAYIQQQQEQIDKLKSLNDSINSHLNDILDKVQQSINQRREAEDNAKTEQDLAKKQRRLAIMRGTSNGGNQVEAAQLQQELAEGQRDYRRTLEDQLLNKLSLQNDAAAKERQKQTQILQAQHDIAKINGDYANEINKWLNEPGQYSKQIEDVLTNAEGLTALTTAEQEAIKNQIGEQMATIQTAPAKIDALKAAITDAGGLQEAVNDVNTDISNSITTASNYITDEGPNSIKNAKEGLISALGADSVSLVDIKKAIEEQKELEKENEKEEEEAKTPEDAKKASDSYNNFLTKRGSATNSGDKYWDKIGATGFTNMVNWGAAIGKSVDQVFYDLINTDAFDQEQILKAAKKANYTAEQTHDWINVITKEKNKEKFKKVWQKVYGKKQFASGGLANFTGPAWLDGTPSKPELVLSATDTQNFVALRDILSKVLSSSNSLNNTYGGDTLYEININVDKIEKDYDVDRVVEKVKKEIVKGAGYRNVTQVRNFR